MRRTMRTALTASFAVAAVLFSPGPLAMASSYNCVTPHCYSIGAQIGSFSGLEGQWDDRVINMPNSEVNTEFGASEQ